MKIPKIKFEILFTYICRNRRISSNYYYKLLLYVNNKYKNRNYIICLCERKKVVNDIIYLFLKRVYYII